MLPLTLIKILMLKNYYDIIILNILPFTMTLFEPVVNFTMATIQPHSLSTKTQAYGIVTQVIVVVRHFYTG